MNPHEQFCPNSDCPARGKVGAGNIVRHSQKEQRCKCTSCGRTFSIGKGTVRRQTKSDRRGRKLRETSPVFLP
jgi:transposase-like protein